jgi:plastocyanin
VFGGNRMKALSIILLIVALVFVVGCSQVVEEPTVDVVVEMPTATVQTPAVHEILISTHGLIPIDLDIMVGDTVEWVNTDSFESYETSRDGFAGDEADEDFERRHSGPDFEEIHTITFNNGSYDIQIPVGGIAWYTFTEPGVYEYISMHNPNMQGAIHVR